MIRQETIQDGKSLGRGRPGNGGIVQRLATRDRNEVRKLVAMGLLPGARVHLIRRYPACVFQIGFSQFAVDQELADKIGVCWDRETGL